MSRKSIFLGATRDEDGIWRQPDATPDCQVDAYGALAEDRWDTDPDAEIDEEIRRAAALKHQIAERALCIAFLRDAEAADPARPKMRTLAKYEERQRRDIKRFRAIMAVVDAYHHPDIDAMPEIEVQDGPLPTTSLELAESRGLLH